MREPTTEQEAVLNSTGRVRVVRAAPGSGKTWLVAEAIQRELKTWRSPTSGIAAISFTRIAGKEIRTAVGHDLGHPHFVGTIDAFLFRYVVRPHLRRTFPNHFADLTLLAGEWGTEHWANLGGGINATVGQGIKVLGCLAIGEDAQRRVLVAHKPHPAAQLKDVVGADLEAVRAAKKEIWRTQGFLTHSDVAFWASKLLEHATRGPILRREIVHRFPVLIVDELQDTGYFLGKSILALLHERAVCGLVVGDPDQAIYEFTGAKPDLFDRFEAIRDSETLVLRASQRCPTSVLAPAIHLKDSPGAVDSTSQATGRAFLVAYDEMVADVTRLVRAFDTAWPDGTVRVLGRATATVDALSRHPAEYAPTLHCRALSHLHRAVVQFRRGRTIAARMTMRAALSSAAFSGEVMTDDGLRARGIDPAVWNNLATRCVLAANDLPTDCVLFEWQQAGGVLLDREILALGSGALPSYMAGRLKPKKRKGWDKATNEFLPQAGSEFGTLSNCPVQTVHGVKGETHDCVILVCPPTKGRHCPSEKWWSNDPADREERRIAYVAMTRSRADLVVCVSSAAYDRLREARSGFVAAFRCMSVNDCIDEVERQPPHRAVAVVVH